MTEPTIKRPVRYSAHLGAIIDDNGHSVSDADSDYGEYLARIINTHDDLLAVCREMVEWYQRRFDDPQVMAKQMVDAFAKAKVALAKAEGGAK